MMLYKGRDFPVIHALISGSMAYKHQENRSKKMALSRQKIGMVRKKSILKLGSMAGKTKKEIFGFLQDGDP